MIYQINLLQTSCTFEILTQVKDRKKYRNVMELKSCKLRGVRVKRMNYKVSC